MRPGDASYLAPRLRAADRAESFAAFGLPPELTLPIGSACADVAFTMVSGQEPIGMFGASSLPSAPSVGVVWLVATPLLERHAVAFLRGSRPWVERLHLRWPTLANRADARNTAHHRWLRWLGFTIFAEEPFGPQGLPFLSFAKVQL